MSATPHSSVLLDEVLAALAPKSGELYVDGTFGAGGYSAAVLAIEGTRVIAIDRDPSVRAHADRLAEQFGDRFRFVEGAFGAMDRHLSQLGIHSVDGVMLDVGVSSMQIDEAARGFSFREDGPLDMRMSSAGTSAADVVNGFPVADLARVIAVYGEEREARRLARAIVRAREDAPVVTTGRLAAIIDAATPKRGPQRIHPATRTFQALRIFVNDELGELVRALHAAERLLATAGRLVVVSFHSLEDRIVKTFLSLRSGRTTGESRHRPPLADSVEGEAPTTFRVLTKRVVTPGEAEVAHNPRARSARLRAAVRLAGDAPPLDPADLGLPNIGVTPCAP